MKMHDRPYDCDDDEPITLRELSEMLWPAGVGILMAFALIWLIGCVGALKGGTPPPIFAPKPQTYNVACVVTEPSGAPVVGARCFSEGIQGATNQDGYLLLKGIPAGRRVVVVSKDGYVTGSADYTADHDQNVAVTLAPKIVPLPPPPTRDEILQAHESFQGAILHTAQFGDLHWWPTAWVSLSVADREASYAQIASWGDTDITVSASWNYGEAGQPYGTGQIVPNTDFLTPTNRLATDFRVLVTEVIRHNAANGKPFVPRIFMEGDNGYAYYMWAMPLIVAALKPQPSDSADLTPYVKLQMCYDSCVPGWAGSSDDKQLISEAILATRAVCPNCVIALEFSSGYSSTGDGDPFWQTDAGRAIDEVDHEGNSWPVSNWEQYWEILDRWLGPAYIKPPEQKSDPDAPFGATHQKFYLRNGTPRGAYLVHCFEPFTYQWVRSGVALDQVSVAFAALKALGCPVIDMPQ